ncbi:glycosyl hydrolase family 17 protein [Gaetbulibacter aestuarii]|uniref:Endo-1,3-beta-glucanase btgC n=2 Tax=Gaetbulibacter aestuarii TaxID=1502358 RepID=A0ABW7MZA5_9FLAO
MLGCKTRTTYTVGKSASEILGNPDYLAVSYGGYRSISRDIQPTQEEIKEDLRILDAMGVHMIRTYNVHLPQSTNILKAIRSLKAENPDFEMYVMLGAWIKCKNANTSEPDHNTGDEAENAMEINRAAALAAAYPDIVKIIAVGNEAMVKWAASYYVQPDEILKWVNFLQNLKDDGKLASNLWITSSDNFASWGGGGDEYHVPALTQLINAVDYISMHTYPMHDTHYNPEEFWILSEAEASKPDSVQIKLLMQKSVAFAKQQYESVVTYMKSLGVNKPVHIGETGWASESNGFFGPDGTRAVDEYKQGLYYKGLREWTNKNGISCFYFEAFDEIWKDSQNPGGSENHFGLFTIEGKVKYALWHLVDEGVFDGLSRNGNPVTKTWNGDKKALMKTVLAPDFSEKETHK